MSCPICFRVLDKSISGRGVLFKSKNRTPEENELIMLHKESKQLRMENDILKAN
jgi:transposase-like protein